MTQQQLLHKRFLNVNMKDVHTYRNVSVSKLKRSNGAFCADVFCQKKKQYATSALMTWKKGKFARCLCLKTSQQPSHVHVESRSTKVHKIRNIIMKKMWNLLSKIASPSSAFIMQGPTTLMPWLCVLYKSTLHRNSSWDNTVAMSAK